MLFIYLIYPEVRKMSVKKLENLKPEIVWQIFEEISKIPRPSKKEEKIRAWVKKWAKENDIEVKKEDATGNILLFKEASKGCEDYPTLILQAHMDMVCQKESNYEIDFENDPIKVKIINGKVTAEGTSLGADNGIGMAYSLAALTINKLKHGPLEVLLTVDEETGLTGAFAIKSGFFTGKYLLNVDSESIGTITISSAGGGGTNFSKKLVFSAAEELTGFKIIIAGLQGGHSGVDIDLPRLNAIKIGADALLELKEIDFQIQDINAGTAHNAIPRECRIELLMPKGQKKEAKKILSSWKEKTLKLGKQTEKEIEITIKEITTKKAMTKTQTQNIVNLLSEVHHGPISYSKEITGLVQTSNNLAIAKIENNEFTAHVSTRSSVNDELEDARAKLTEIGKEYSFKVELNEAYPGWEPNPDSPFIKLVKEKYEKVLKKDVELEAIHAGLECGLFKAIDPDLQIASIGPNIKNAHSPDEFVEIESVEILWNLITKTIEGMGEL